MPASVYECMFLLDTNKVAGDTATTMKQLHGILERNQAEVLVSRPWDDRKLAYPIKGHKKGLYHLTYFRTDGKNLATIERDFALNETILRDRTVNEAAEVLGVPAGTVKSRVYYALKALRVVLAERGVSA